MIESFERIESVSLAKTASRILKMILFLFDIGELKNSKSENKIGTEEEAKTSVYNKTFTLSFGGKNMPIKEEKENRSRIKA